MSQTTPATRPQTATATNLLVAPLVVRQRQTVRPATTAVHELPNPTGNCVLTGRRRRRHRLRPKAGRLGKRRTLSTVGRGRRSHLRPQLRHLEGLGSATKAPTVSHPSVPTRRECNRRQPTPQHLGQARCWVLRTRLPSAPVPVTVTATAMVPPVVAMPPRAEWRRNAPGNAVCCTTPW